MAKATKSRRPCRCAGTRREFLWEMGAGFTGLALTALLDQDGFFQKHGFAAERLSEALLSPRPPHFAPRAKHCIFIFLYGGPSQVDTWDYKPELQKNHGKTVELEIRRHSFQKGTLLASPYGFRQCGQSGLWCSEKFPFLARHMDEICLIKSLYTDSFAHGSAMIQMNTGRLIQGAPALGSWLCYGLGTENQNLPGFVVMLDARGGPISGAANWSSGFMPAAYQGTHLRNKGEPILDLRPKDGISPAMQRDMIDTLAQLNSAHLADRPGFSELPARIASYELAFRLQMAAPEAMDLSTEDARTLKLYGVDGPKPEHKVSLGPGPLGTQLLIARRLIERGVRFVQIYSGGGHQQENWDAHEGIRENLDIHAPEIDQPIHGLLTDLRLRGLLEETLVIWGGEFGRQPVAQGSGRDHNPKGFTYCLAGGGVKGGFSYGETDELGHEAVVKPTHIRDLHATILHLMGLDHRKLTYFYGGLHQKLTGVQEAHVIHELLD
jgi:hypothetical protein